MEEDLDDENVDNTLQLGEDAQDKRTRPPNRRKFDEEMQSLTNQIKEKEAELEKMKSSGDLHISKDLNSLRAQAHAKITRRKEINTQLDKFNKEMPEKMKHLNQLGLSLYYKSEEKINTAIQRLEWNLKVQSFKLREEKKIVSEIDGLKRSKKTLAQYLTLSQEIKVIRDQQRSMRDERDALYRSVSEDKAKEEKLRANASVARWSLAHLKREIDSLYETRRSMLSNFRRQKEEYNEVKEKQRKEGLKRRESLLQDKRKRIAEKEAAKIPFEEEIHLCNTLMAYLGRFTIVPVSESSADSQDDPEFAEEIDDGQYVLLKKTDEDYSGNSRKLSRKNRRSRKQSMIKQMTHTPEALNQFLTLNLVAPPSTADIGETLDKLVALKAQYERAQSVSPHVSEVASDAGVSATESLICEMSRQVSKTESSEEGGGEGGEAECAGSPGEEEIYADLLLHCFGGSESLGQAGARHSGVSEKPSPDEREECGAVGGSAEVWDSQDGTGPNSDSTVEGDTGSVESQASASEVVSSTSVHPPGSDSIGGAALNYASIGLEALGGAPLSYANKVSSAGGSGSDKAGGPALLYSEMLNKPRREAAQRTDQQNMSAAFSGARDKNLSPSKGHPPLSSSTSSPASFFHTGSHQQVSAGPGRHAQSLDSGHKQSTVPKARDVGGHGRGPAGYGRGKDTVSVHRRSTFSGHAKEPPNNQEKGKTARERRETFSGQRKEKNNAQGEQVGLPSQEQAGRGGPWKRLAVSPFPQPEASTSRNGSLPSRPKDLMRGRGSSPNFPSLSASWSGVASGSIRSAVSPHSASGPLTTSYSTAVVSPQLTSSSSFSSPNFAQVSGSHHQQSQQPFSSSRQHKTLSPRTSAPSVLDPPAHYEEQKSAVGARASFPHSPVLSPGLPRQPLTPVGADSPSAQTSLPSPMGSLSGRVSLLGIEDDFPPLSLSASMPTPQRRNSSNSSFSSRSFSSTMAVPTAGGNNNNTNTSSQAQPQSTTTDVQVSFPQQQGISSQAHYCNTNGDYRTSSATTSYHTHPLGAGPAPDSHATDLSVMALAPSTHEELGNVCGDAQPVSVATRQPPAEQVSTPGVIPTDSSFTARWVESSREYHFSDLSPPPSATIPQSGDCLESTHL